MFEGAGVDGTIGTGLICTTDGVIIDGYERGCVL